LVEPFVVWIDKLRVSGKGFGHRPETIDPRVYKACRSFQTFTAHRLILPIYHPAFSRIPVGHPGKTQNQQC
jgi:hypothetical protein